MLSPLPPLEVRQKAKLPWDTALEGVVREVERAEECQVREEWGDGTSQVGGPQLQRGDTARVPTGVATHASPAAGTGGGRIGSSGSIASSA